MRYLHEAGKSFAEAHPEAARYLNIESITDRDPYVERLFEGFAFLAGRIHERLDDELPVYTEGLCSLLYPHFLCPVPSMCLVELRPKPGMIQETTVLKRGLEIRSAPTGDERAVCQFQTTAAVRLQPMQIGDAGVDWRADGSSSARMRFKFQRGVDPRKLTLSPLRLYFHGDPATASTMHRFFTQHVARVTVQAEPAGGSALLYGQRWVLPGALGADEGLLPYSPGTPQALRLLQEYLCFRRKFWCVDLDGLDQLELSSDAEGFAVEIAFDERFPENRRFNAENVRLHCVPAVNLFTVDAEPIRVEHLESEYLIVPSVRYRRSQAIYDVQEVVGIEDGTARRSTYAPFLGFRENLSSREESTYVIRRRTGPMGRPESYISLSSPSAGDGGSLKSQTLSLRVRCTNGFLPREKLHEGMLDRLAPDVPQLVQPTNITQPSLILYPPIDRHEDFYWRLISHWSFNHASVASREPLVGLLALYDWGEGDANRRRYSGIEDVEWAPKDIPYRGAVMRGAEVTLRIRDGHFEDGELNLFGIILSNFFSLYATINSFVHVAIERTPSGKRSEWHPTQGAMPLI